MDLNLKCISSIIDNDTLGYPITSICFNHDSKNLAFSAKNGVYKIYHLATAEYILNSKIINDYVVSILFNKDSSKLIIGTKKGDLITYNSPLYNQINIKIQFNLKINIIKLSTLSKDVLGIAFEDGSIKIFNLMKNEVSFTFNNIHSGECTCLSFSPVHRTFLCTCGLDGFLNFYDFEKEKRLVTSINTGKKITSVSFVEKGDHVLCSDESGFVYLYDLRNSKEEKCVFKGNKGKINYIEINKKIEKVNKNNNNNFAISNNNNYNEKIKETESSFNNSTKKNLMSSNKSLNKIQSKEKDKNDDDNLIDIKNNNNNVMEISEFRNSLKNNNNKNNNHIKQNEIIKNKDDKINEKNELLNLFKKKEYLNNKNYNNLNNKEDEDYFNEDNIDLDMKKFIKKTIKDNIKEESNKIKNFIHDEITSLHVDIIKQFEIQQNKMMQIIKKFSLLNSKMAIRIEELEKENTELKSQFF